MTNDFSVNILTQIFKEKIIELQEEPEFQRSNDKTKFATNKNGDPAVKMALGNVPLDYDLWEGLRNPAVVGMYPAGLREIWEFYANRRRGQVDETGRQTIFQVPRSFDFALNNFRRAVIISVMLPFSKSIVHDYVDQVIKGKKASSHRFTNMYEDINRMLDKALTRTAIELVTDDSDRVVVAFNNDTVKAISTEAIPQTRQGGRMVRLKAVTTRKKVLPLSSDWVNLVFPELSSGMKLTGGKVERFAGPIRSIIIFDKQLLVTDGQGGIIYPAKAWRRFLFQLFDFTNTKSDINQYRFCSHIPLNDKGCNKCMDCCPSGAQPGSAPQSDGRYSQQVARQAHRFWESSLQFDYGKCCDDRGQMAGLFPEWSCARCLTVCVDQGIRRKQSVRDFYLKMSELAKKS